MKKYLLFAIATLCMALSFVSCDSSDDDDNNGSDSKYKYVAVLTGPTDDVKNYFNVEATVEIPGLPTETIDVTNAVATSDGWKLEKTSNQDGKMKLTVVCKMKDENSIKDDQDYFIQITGGVGIGTTSSSSPKIRVSTLIGRGLNGAAIKKLGTLSETITFPMDE